MLGFVLSFADRKTTIEAPCGKNSGNAVAKYIQSGYFNIKVLNEHIARELKMKLHTIH
jgi:hypothetical protein|tara:strand:- start:59 stop:232 length:174 start_codon:yes stop_codon:yes gene_type:complete